MFSLPASFKYILSLILLFSVLVKPGIPTNVMVMDVTPTSVVVRWSPPKYMGYQFTPGLEYSVQYKALSPVLGTVQVFLFFVTNTL